MPQGLDNNNWEDIYNIRSIFHHVAKVIDDLLLNVWDARYPLMELFKNALYHGNKLDLTLPIFLYIDLDKRVIEVCDLQLEREIAKQVFNLAHHTKLTGVGVGVTNIREQG